MPSSHLWLREWGVQFRIHRRNIEAVEDGRAKFRSLLGEFISMSPEPDHAVCRVTDDGREFQATFCWDTNENLVPIIEERARTIVEYYGKFSPALLGPLVHELEDGAEFRNPAYVTLS